MKRLAISFLLLFAVYSIVSAQEEFAVESICHFLGTTDPEDINIDEAERIMGYIERPLKLNSSSVEKLISSGLMSRYQAMSLADYRQRHGNIMSFAELASIDGFSYDYVKILKPFITLSSAEIGISSNSANIRYDIISRTGLKVSEDFRYNYGIKIRSRCGDKAYAGFSASSVYSHEIKRPDYYSACISYRFHRIPLRLVAGDFNARFGQGLALWNGMSISGVSSPDSFMRNQSGISETWSFTGSSAYTGIAAEFVFGHLNVSSMIAVPGIKNNSPSILPALNIIYRHKCFQAGITHYCQYSSCEKWEGMKTATDMAACIKGTDIFGEIAYDWRYRAAAGLAGVIFRAGDDLKMSAMIRYYPSTYESHWSGAVRSRTNCSNEHSVSLGSSILAGKSISKKGSEGFGASVRRHSATCSVDVAYLPDPVSDGGKNIQVKLLVDWTHMISESLQVKARLTERIRTWDPKIRNDFRLDISWFSSRFHIVSRVNALHYRNTAILSYVDGSYKGKKVGIHLRQGVFMIDEWDDRIYVYERDAAGSFNVPAFYGRGVWTSLYATLRLSQKMKLNMRASLTAYPFMKKRKPGKAELKLQYTLSF